ncbi:hypothetical protein MKEN_00632900 [Mycena kentingensis (nom. inval.)]|nr:hypothetical protein MKEN_00632900 [Mycena kentingensis (nom. inval.)]
MARFAALLALLVAPLALCAGVTPRVPTETSLTSRATSPISLASSKWIWQGGAADGSVVALRKGFTPPLGKSLIAAEVVITAVATSYQFFVNGAFVGSKTPPRGRFAHRFCIDILPSFNVFAVNATTSGSTSAMIATILLTYSDLTTSTIVSDASWRVHAAVPGFEQLSFDDTAWATATVEGSLGDDPWAEVHIPASPARVSLQRGQWVWTDAVPASGVAHIPAGVRAFRRTFTPFPGQAPASTDILITADNIYTLWVNGVHIATNASLTTAEHYVVNFVTPPTKIVYAVLVNNTAASAAGLLVEAEINMVPSGRVNCTAGSFALTDVSWVSTKGAIPAGWEQPEFDDSAWPAVVPVGSFPTTQFASWNSVTVQPAMAPIDSHSLRLRLQPNRNPSDSEQHGDQMRISGPQ